MSSPGSPTLVFDVSTRRAESRVAWMALAGCAVTSILVYTSIGRQVDPAAMAAWAAAILSATVIISVGLSRVGWLGGGRRIQHVVWLSGGGWLLTDAAGRNYTGCLRGNTRVAGRWTWLSWTIDIRAGAGAIAQPRRYLLLGPGDISAPDMRRLVVRLRMAGISGQGPATVPAT
jgi:hypothetical protein